MVEPRLIPKRLVTRNAIASREAESNDESEGESELQGTELSMTFFCSEIESGWCDLGGDEF